MITSREGMGNYMSNFIRVTDMENHQELLINVHHIVRAIDEDFCEEYKNGGFHKQHCTRILMTDGTTFLIPVEFYTFERMVNDGGDNC